MAGLHGACSICVVGRGWADEGGPSAPVTSLPSPLASREKNMARAAILSVCCGAKPPTVCQHSSLSGRRRRGGGDEGKSPSRQTVFLPGGGGFSAFCFSATDLAGRGTRWRLFRRHFRGKPYVGMLVLSNAGTRNRPLKMGVRIIRCRKCRRVHFQGRSLFCVSRWQCEASLGENKKCKETKRKSGLSFARSLSSSFGGSSLCDFFFFRAARCVFLPPRPLRTAALSTPHAFAKTGDAAILLLPFFFYLCV